MKKKRKRKRTDDHAFSDGNVGSSHCKHRTRRGWLGMVVCGYPKSAHRIKQ